MSTRQALALTVRICVVLGVTIVLTAACGSHASPPGRYHPSSAAPLSCRQQYQNWKHGQAQASGLQGALRHIQADAQSGDAAGMRAAMKELMPAALAMADHPMPRCADPARLYAAFVTRIYKAGSDARPAKGLSALRRAAAPLKGLKEIGRQMAAELDRAVGTNR